MANRGEEVAVDEDIEISGDFNARKGGYAVGNNTSGSGEETLSLRTGQQRRIKYADVTNSIVLVVLCAGLAILIALAAATLNKVNSQKTTIVYPYSVSVAYSSLGLIVLLYSFSTRQLGSASIYRISWL